MGEKGMPIQTCEMEDGFWVGVGKREGGKDMVPQICSDKKEVLGMGEERR